MKTITVYDFEAKKLEELAESYGLTVAEVVETLVDRMNEDDLK